MLKIGELKPGNLVKVRDEGVEREGVVVDISHEENQALIDNGIQEFWYNPEEILPVTVNEDQLMKLGFEKEVMEDGLIKYKKGAFRLAIFKEGDFSEIEMWYREDRRHFHHPIEVHQLQNLHLQMTKVPLELPA
ncbi:MAG: hypothetical protein C4308_03590 [Chitinophagaceae bacterium]